MEEEKNIENKEENDFGLVSSIDKNDLKVDNIDIVEDKEEQERTKKKKVEFLENFDKSLGIIKRACSLTGICRQAYYNWYEDDSVFKEMVESIKRNRGDAVESKLFEHIAKDALPAITFYLRSCHPKYKQHLQLSGDIGVNKYENLTDEQLDRQIGELSEGTKTSEGGEASKDSESN